MPITRSGHSPLAALAAGTAALVLAIVPVAAANAADGDPTGWVRLAHLSPDTRAVDVMLTPASGDGKTVELTNVPYGKVSDYLPLPTGEYAVTMVPAGADSDSPPVVEASVDIQADSAATVAVFGKNAELTTRVIEDDLTPPRPNRARVRLVQASVKADPVTLSSSDGTVVASDAEAASVSGYVPVPAGGWTLSATQGSTKSSTDVKLKQGQVVSLFILDRSDGAIELRPIVDSAGAGATPRGFIATGGGYLADKSGGWSAPLAAAGIVVLGAGAVTVGRLRRRSRVSD